MPTKTKREVRPAEAAEAAPGARAWSEALRSPQLRDLPFKIETNARGRLVLSPHKSAHSFSQYRIGRLLEERIGAHQGRIGVAFAVHTAGGVEVPDVVWISAERAAQIPEDAEASPVMPEICVEVLSTSNTAEEMDEKRALFFEGGAGEVWIVDVDGSVTFYDTDEAREKSTLAPGFPSKVDR